jgi:hypothetical protein
VDTLSITSQLIRRLPVVVKKTDSWLLQLPVLPIAIGSLNPAILALQAVIGLAEPLMLDL